MHCGFDDIDILAPKTTTQRMRPREEYDNNDDGSYDDTGSSISNDKIFFWIFGLDVKFPTVATSQFLDNFQVFHSATRSIVKCLGETDPK